MVIGRRLAQPRLLTFNSPLGIATFAAAALLLSSQFKLILSLTGLRPKVLEDDLGTTVPVESKAPVNQHGLVKKASSNSTSKRITCDASPCNGFFAYDGPNKDKKAALDVLEKAVATYNYGGERNNETHNRMIFMPNTTNDPSCVIEWKESRPKWVDRDECKRRRCNNYDAFFSSDSFRGENHTYMEIGAHDGVRESNSRFFDICLGWNGLLVEPHPKNYDRTVRLRPNAHHLGIAPSCTANESGTILFPEHMYTSAQVNEKGSKIEIHCGPLQYYLDALEIRHIDFWSLDVEGSELKVLETVDFDRTHVDVIIAESQNRLSYLPEIQKKVEDVRLLLQSRGYLMINSVVVTKSDVFLHKRACASHGNIKECNAVSR